MTDKHSLPTLIVGAGPTGLSAAVELARFGKPFRIIEQHAVRPELSKALGINSNTLELLKDCGATTELLDQGRKAQTITFRNQQRKLWDVSFDGLSQPYKFIVILPQADTERIIERRLNHFGTQVERGNTLVKFEDHGTEVHCKIEREGKTEEFIAGQVFGGDGAHSVLRHALEIPFAGHTDPTPWSLADVELAWNLENPDVNILFCPEGMIFLMLIRDSLFRVAANHEQVLNRLPKEVEVKNVNWETKFAVSHRLVPSYGRGNVYLGGDSAHIHSPLGGRGMNLGIADGVSFAHHLCAGTLGAYSPERHEQGVRTVKMVSKISKLATSRNPGVQFARIHVVPKLMKYTGVAKNVAAQMSGY